MTDKLNFHLQFEQNVIYYHSNIDNGVLHRYLERINEPLTINAIVVGKMLWNQISGLSKLSKLKWIKEKINY